MEINWTCENLKLLCIRGHYQQFEKATQGWEKIFVNSVSDRRLVSRIYKEVLQLNN